MARPIQARRSICVRCSTAIRGSERNAGFPAKAPKTRVPVVIALAAKCIARIAIRGPFSPSANQSILGLLSDLKSETAVGRVRVGRKHTPLHSVGSATRRSQRYRHLAATDSCLAGIHALARGIQHRDRTESWF